ncbi:hypothetical protein DFH09DRAFT_1089990 [Mycena vulgaris]|nr:hypothetical protein DFH09DRAFT_1089990 [Mycena vulgaris]
MPEGTIKATRPMASTKPKPQPSRTPIGYTAAIPCSRGLVPETLFGPHNARDPPEITGPNSLPLKTPDPRRNHVDFCPAILRGERPTPYADDAPPRVTLREVEDLYYDPITMRPFNVDTTGSAVADLALELIAYGTPSLRGILLIPRCSPQDKARTLRMETLRSTACPMAWWRELCATCTGQSLAIWRCSRDLTRLRDVLQEQIDIFHSEFAEGHSAAVRLEVGTRLGHGVYFLIQTPLRAIYMTRTSRSVKSNFPLEFNSEAIVWDL